MSPAGVAAELLQTNDDMLEMNARELKRLCRNELECRLVRSIASVSHDCRIDGDQC